MSHQTEDFEHVLDDDGVQAVEYDSKSDTVTVFVSEKLPASEVTDGQLVSERIPDHQTQVVEVGDIGVQPSVEPDVSTDGAEGHRDRLRPPRPGASEIQEGSTAATAGLLAEVVETAQFHESVAAGERVRLSNAHVYGDVQHEYGSEIVQPSPYDGGNVDDDAVGRFVGYCPVTHRTVDAAARTTPDDESNVPVGFDDVLSGVFDGSYADLRGETVVKSGRTTGVTDGTVRAVDASVRVRYGGEHGVVTKRNQLLCTAMSQGGDSGSLMALEESREVVGHVFAGSDRVTVANRVDEVQSELGVEIVTDGQGHEPENEFSERVYTYFETAYGEENVHRQQYFSETGREADIVVETGLVTLMVEIGADSTINDEVGQALLYSRHDSQYTDFDAPFLPLVVMPNDHPQHPEAEMVEPYASIVEEDQLRAQLGLESLSES